MLKSIRTIHILIVGLVILSVFSLSLAQEDTMIEPMNLSSAPVILQFSTSAMVLL